jgi:hypothetical protein
MRSIGIALVCMLLVMGGAYAQSERGTITGTIADAAGAMVPNAPVEAKNTQTGAEYKAASSGTGNYVLAQLPTGTYQVIVKVAGFKQYVRTGITVLAAQTLRIDIALALGSPTETVTVSADAPLLKTESGELSHNIATDRLNDLPMLSGATGMRDPFAAMNLMPGTSGTSNYLRVDGSPGFTMALRIDGQDATQQIWTLAYTMSTPSVDSVQETAIQTSNYAAEYGQAGGGILNMTMRSGTNKLHGSAFEYFRNEALNAHPPYKKAPAYEKPRDRRHDFGFNLGVPVYLPKIYDGRDKTFFFYSFEQNRQKSTTNATYTFPTVAFQNGDFSALLGASVGTDPLGRDVLAGTIFDPSTTRTYTDPTTGASSVIRDPFMGCDGKHLNQICMSTAPIDPVARKYQTLYPKLTNNNLTNNLTVFYPSTTLQTTNAFKIDHTLSPKLKISGYYSLNSQSADFLDGLAVPISSGRMLAEKSHTIRLTGDYTIAPTKLLHLGVGIMHFLFKDPQANTNFNSKQELGLPGTFATVAPNMTMDTTRGGLRTTGPVAYGNTWQIKPTGTASFSWVKGNHSYKFGGEVRFESHPNTVFTPANGNFIFDAAQTSMPYLGPTVNTGHVYASFLLGMFNKGEIGVPNRFHLGKNAWAFYAQDSWKVTRKLTLDYGLRWDYQTYLQETYGRMPTFSPFAVNPTYGNLKGDAIFKKDIADVYPHAWGPRLGLAYQLMPKTVLRAGIGISYGQTGALEMWNLRMGSFVRYGPNPTYGNAIGLLKNGPNVGGVPVVPVWPNRNPGQAPAAAGSDYMPWINDQAGRPPRQVQWSIGIQREIAHNLSVEVSYVGNRGIWWNSNGSFSDPNRVTPSILAAHNIDLTKAADRSLMLTPLSSVSAADMSLHKLSVPFAGFSGAVNQSLRPFPHIGNIFMIWAPLGRTWYDSMQVKVTKRYSHGLDFTAAYSWQKELTIGAETNDTAFVTPAAVNNINNVKSNKTLSGLSMPHRIAMGISYQVPEWKANKYASRVFGDWTLGAMLTYSTGLPIMAPRATNANGNDIGTLLKLCSGMGVLGGCNGSLFMPNSPASYAGRVPGQNLFLVDPNSKFDPFTNFLLNPKAWVNPPDGQYGTGSAYYSDYRYRRAPSENMSLGRNFVLREGMTLSLRIELMNIFNRVQIPSPGVDFNSNNATQGQLAIGGKPVFGFGYINPIDAAGQRTGQIVMRFSF